MARGYSRARGWVTVGPSPRRQDIEPIGYAGGAPAAVGGAALLEGETNGFAADFTYATDAQRVAKKAADVITYSGLSFFTSSGTSSKWVWNAAGVLVNIPVGTLPLNYDPVTHAPKGLLCEPAATNLLTGSTDFSTGWSPAGVTKSLNQGTAPNGANDLVKFTMNAGGGVHYTFAASAGSVSKAVSVYAKAGTLNWICIASAAATTDGVYFNLATGAVGTQKGTSTGTMENCGNGIYRCVAVIPAATFLTLSFHSADNQNPSWGAVGGETIFVWQPQSETGSVATSIIPTAASTVTRAVDSYNVTAASVGNSGTAGSWWAEMSHNVALAGTPRIIGTAGAASPLYYTAATTPGMLDTTGLTKTTTTIVGSTHKVISAFASGDRAFTADGLAAATDAGATSGLLAPVTLYFGNGSSTPMNGYIRKVRYLPRRPTNAELATMTGS